jgi:hypothetical protein
MTTLAAHHQVMVAAMQTKQSVDPKTASALSKSIAGIAGFWPAK